MKLSGILVAGCLVTCAMFTAWLAPDAAGATFLGMIAPLLVGVATILLVERTTRTDLGNLTARMTTAFIVKMVFYAAYVSLAIAGLRVEPAAFIVSFTLYFVTLQITEALYFKTLFDRAGAAAG